jgi:hypothetical protein
MAQHRRGEAAIEIRPIQRLRKCRHGHSLPSQDLTEADPRSAIEASELHLFERRKACGAGIDLDSGQQQRKLDVREIRRLPHHRLAREIVATASKRNPRTVTPTLSWMRRWFVERRPTGIAPNYLARILI